MTIYASSDIHGQSAVPGCPEEHLRPVDPASGRPVEIWGLDCPAHEAFLRGDHKPKVLKYITDPKTGVVISQQRVPDSDPRWSSTPDTVPLTPDEMRTHHLKLEKGENQLRALESLMALKAGGIDLSSRPEVLFFLQKSGLPPEALRTVQGTTVCPAGHDNPAGNAFCGSCGTSMSGQKAITAEPAADLGSLHVAKLKKLARDRGLSDAGSKADVLQRLQAA